MPTPRPELNGLRLKLPNQDPIYLIDRGLRRHIPNPATYHNLFGASPFQEDLNLLDIQEGAEISDGAVLARAEGTAPIYLVEQGSKRHIMSPSIMNQYGFGGPVQVVAPILLAGIQNGPDIAS
jgi:hypothetical protein